MRYVLTGLLAAALMVGCGDDDGGDGDKPAADSGAKDSGTNDSGVKDAGGSPSMDASVDSGLLDAGLKDSGATTGDSSTPATTATATLESKSGSTVKGTAKFTVSGGLVTLTLDVTGAEPGMRGAHIHANPVCTPDDATGAGGHWNPTLHVHGSGATDAGAISHLGDLGNILINADGKGSLTISKPEWKLGDGSAADVVGHAVIVHKNTDDLVTDASDAGPGMSGARLACGVITK
jgi:Cu-Zn family superoxide dismutase